MSKRILVVEDQEDSRRILRDLLTSADYEMTEAVNGEEALASVEKQRPDLILMDIQMPVLDGYEATRRIKADPALKDVPIIVVTSYASSGGDEAKARAAGCDDFVPKPFSPTPVRPRATHVLCPPFSKGLARPARSSGHDDPRNGCRAPSRSRQPRRHPIGGRRRQG